ncbi:MAG: polysaccharide biosynthesis protein [Proteobacteria bacterium]|nr:polysaccharide biosynthesis protein [Pseudomonadota bacterium]
MKENQRGLPRFIEVPSALVGLIALSPLLCFGALLVALSSPGPILFRQVRIGLHGRKFMLYKFRTMKVAESTLQITAKDDDRITRLGRFLRKTKIDEFPGLWNIVKGDMSVVGPRPEVENYVDLNDQIWRQILAVRPGITFPITLFLRDEEELLAQVKGDREEFYLKTLLPLKLQCYVEYIRSRSAWSDTKVILQTILAVIFPHRSFDLLQHTKFGENKILFRKDKKGGNALSIPSTIKRPIFWVMVGADTLLSIGAYYIAYCIRFEGFPPAEYFYVFAVTVVWIVLIKLIFLLYFKLYSGMWRYTGVHDLLNLLRALSISSGVILLGMLSLYRFGRFSRAVFLIDFLLSIIFLGGYRLGMRLMIPHLADKELRNEPEMQKSPQKRLVIIGAGNAGEKLLREINENPRLNYEVVGFVDDNVSKIMLTIHGVPVLGSLKMLPSVVRDFRIDEIIIAVPSASAREMRKMVSFSKITNMPFKTIPGIGEFIEGKVSASGIRDVRYEDLLGREQVEIDANEIGQYLTGKKVVVTGAAGSIGSELCRQIVAFKPSSLILVDRNESGLYELEMEFKANFPKLNILPVLTAIQNKPVMQKTFDQHQVQVVFHAAAYKHIPMMEEHPWEAVFNNIIGTQVLLELCIENNVERCVVVSTDKAVRPSNVVGATKRLTELLTQAYAKKNHSRFIVVRFGNVIGSAGSVVPLFRKQIAQGGPVTVTHKDATRYFMTIHEACRLILQTGAIGHGGEIFVLKMGIPVRIDDLARDMITLSGFKPDEDIYIEYTGLRPGEKFHEESRADGEDVVPTHHEKIMVLSSEKEVSIGKLTRDIDVLVQLAVRCDGPTIKKQLGQMIEEYNREVTKSTIVPSPSDEMKIRDDQMAASDRHSARILVIDDEREIADMLATYLDAAGYSTCTAYSGTEGLSAIVNERFDVVITDLMLSDMRGTQILEAVKKQNRKTGVIIMTGYTTIESNAEAIQKGAQDFISKPLSFAELETIIERTLREAERVYE